MIFWKVGYPNIFFQEICSSGGKQTIHKVSAAFIVKNCHPRKSLIRINILQSEQIFETENNYLKHKARFWNIEQIFEVRNEYLKYGINIWNIEQTFEIKNKYMKYGNEYLKYRTNI